MSRKNLSVVLVVVVISGALLAGCASPPAPPSAAQPAATSQPAKSEPACDFDQKTCDYLKGKDFSGKTLTVGVWGGDIANLLKAEVVPVLEARGAKVEMLLGGAGDRLAKVYAEKGNPTMDVAYLNIHTGPQAQKDGVVEAPSNEVPAYADLYDFAKSGCYGVSLGGIGILYSKKTFPNPPEWKDLWGPEVKGKIAFPTWPSTGGDALLAVAGRLIGKDEHDTDGALKKIAELLPVPLVFTSNDELNLMMGKGDVVASPQMNAYAWAGVDKDQALGFSWPQDPGAVLTMDMLCITQGTKNRELALAWTQLALSPKIQQLYAEKLYFGPTNSTVQLSGTVAERVVYGKERVDQLTKLDYPFIVQARKDLVERWNKEILGK